ncbi:MAG: endonuclease III [Syntrophales bacterium]|nr:endonuclease III [Syntrophales bacterium]
MENYQIERVIKLVEDYLKEKEDPIVTQLADKKESPFTILISALLSARTKDEVTQKACERLFARAKKPQDIITVSQGELEQIIYPVGFYRTKARHIKKLCAHLLQRFDGYVPDNLKDLLSLPGVGRKTANLVLSLAFKKDAICVDTHVHRITNRLGWVKTKHPEETEMQLMEILPRRYWQRINTLLVKYGQEICRPINPHCGACPIQTYCRYGSTSNIKSDKTD